LDLNDKAKLLVERAPKMTVVAYINKSCDLIADLLEEVDALKEANIGFRKSLGEVEARKLVHARLNQQLEESQKFIDDLKGIISDHQRLVRELDLVWNGEEGAAPQASLCDLVAQIRNDVAAMMTMGKHLPESV